MLWGRIKVLHISYAMLWRYCTLTCHEGCIWDTIPVTSHITRVISQIQWTPQTLNKVHEPLMKDEQYSAWNAVMRLKEGIGNKMLELERFWNFAFRCSWVNVNRSLGICIRNGTGVLGGIPQFHTNSTLGKFKLIGIVRSDCVMWCDGLRLRVYAHE